MGLNPIPIALVCVIGYSLQLLLLAGGEVTVDLEEPSCSIGGLDFLQDLAECASDVAGWVLQFFSFQLVGMPWFIGVPLGVGCTGSLIWAFAQLVRGV